MYLRTIQSVRTQRILAVRAPIHTAAISTTALRQAKKHEDVTPPRDSNPWQPPKNPMKKRDTDVRLKRLS
jgi:hypothetical protein